MENVLEETTDEENDKQFSGSQTETKSWEPDWEGLVNQVMVEDPEPVLYPLKIFQDPSQQESDDEESDNNSPPSIPLTCQVVKVQRYAQTNQFFATNKM